MRGAAANLAVSWLLASGTESQVRFAKSVHPTPVIFIGASLPVPGVPKLAISQVTSDSFKVQVFGTMCNGTTIILQRPSQASLFSIKSPVSSCAKPDYSWIHSISACWDVSSVRPSPASTELKVVASYLALPPGQYLAKHSPCRLVVGSITLTAPGDVLVRIPFSIADPSKVRRRRKLLEPCRFSLDFPWRQWLFCQPQCSISVVVLGS